MLMVLLAAQVAASVLQQLHEASSQDTSTFQVMHILSAIQEMIEFGPHNKIGL